MTIYHFSLEGNIAAGKSTLIKKLKTELLNVNQLPVVYLSEPVKLWEDIGILEHFYKDKERYSFTFQITVMTTLKEQLDRIREQYDNCILITERSIFTTMEVFAQLLFDEGKLSNLEYAVLKVMYDNITKGMQLSGIIYLNTPTNECYDRFVKRARPGEAIELDYLVQLETYYLEFIKTQNSFICEDGNVRNIRNFLFDRTSMEFLSKC